MIAIRQPVAAGSFYNLDEEMLRKQIEGCFKHKLGPRGFKKQKAFAAVVPHAGYIYSGPVAAWIFSRIEECDYIVLGPNHIGTGAQFALMKNGLWKTPLGSIAIHEQLAEKLLKSCRILEHDVMPHQYEHSIEVQLPFLQYRFGNDFRFVPISILNEFADDALLDSCRVVGKAIAEVAKKEKRRVMILASSDFSHYVPQKVAKEIDLNVIKAIKKLDEKDFFERINEKSASICGFGPIATAMVAAKALGAKKADLLRYATSGDIVGEPGPVVGYASLLMK